MAEESQIPPVARSILNTIKKALGLDPSYDVFDTDLVMHINSTFATLSQLGVGPEEGFSIEDDSATWQDFLGLVETNKLLFVKSYMYLKVRLLFDPPTTSFAIDAMKKNAEEYEWRLNVQTENSRSIATTQPIISRGGDH